MSKITNDCLTRSATGYVIAVLIWQQWRQRVKMVGRSLRKFSPVFIQSTSVTDRQTDMQNCNRNSTFNFYWRTCNKRTWSAPFFVTSVSSCSLISWFTSFCTHHGLHLRSHHLSLPRPFTPDLKLICFTNPFLHIGLVVLVTCHCLHRSYTCTVYVLTGHCRFV